MLPVLEGTIAWRVLLNFRADAAVVRRLVPEPLEVVTRNGYAVVGVCLIRLERLAPKGFPSLFGMSSENMAHRVAVWYPSSGGMREGVYIWRRETDRALVALLGGRAFPGVHRLAAFEVAEEDNRLSVNVRTRDRQADVSFVSQYPAGWQSTALFRAVADASRFFEHGDCGFSRGLRGDHLEGMRLRPFTWDVTPLAIRQLRSAFCEDRDRFPTGAVEFDCALLMRGIPHEWHPLSLGPEFGGMAAWRRP